MEARYDSHETEGLGIRSSQNQEETHPESCENHDTVESYRAQGHFDDENQHNEDNGDPEYYAQDETTTASISSTFTSQTYTPDTTSEAYLSEYNPSFHSSVCLEKETFVTLGFQTNRDHSNLFCAFVVTGRTVGAAQRDS